MLLNIMLMALYLNVKFYEILITNIYYKREFYMKSTGAQASENERYKVIIIQDTDQSGLGQFLSLPPNSRMGE